MKKAKKSSSSIDIGHDPFALSREFFTLSKEIAAAGLVRFPLALTRSWIKDSGLDPVWNESRLLEIVGDTLLACVNNLGPIYGKCGQIMLTRMNGSPLSPHLHLDRLYHAWPALPFKEIETILDREIPEWRQELIVERAPLGVASMAQVHAAVDDQGREWVIKIVKPQAKKRLEESIRALEQLLLLMKPAQISASGRRFRQEAENLLKALRKEARLDEEKRNLNRMRQKLEGKKQEALRLPRTNDRFCTPSVLVIERFRGLPMSDIVEGHCELKPEVRKKLAKRVLQELMVQVFEVGLFHGDPHAGNLMLLEDGSVGLFDWGLTGELSDDDRRHISEILKSLLASDVERLTGVLLEIARESNPDATRASIIQEMKKVADVQAAAKEQGIAPTLTEMTEACLAGCDNLGIRVPEGLLMMVKSLLTIEGLAKGIDPELSFTRAAGPILFKAAKPNLQDILSMSRKLPNLMKKVLAS